MDKFERLKQDGIAHGMCKKFRDEWTNPDIATLCQYFFRGQDFCIEQDWPSMELAHQLFTPEEVAEHGIYITDGESFDQTNVAALDKAEVHVFVKQWGTCDIYARHNSTVHLHLGAGSFCYVTVRDNATVIVENKEPGATLKASYFGGLINEPQLFDTIHDKTKKEE